jgi:hypothetical protein
MVHSEPSCNLFSVFVAVFRRVWECAKIRHFQPSFDFEARDDDLERLFVAVTRPLIPFFSLFVACLPVVLSFAVAFDVCIAVLVARSRSFARIDQLVTDSRTVDTTTTCLKTAYAII